MANDLTARLLADIERRMKCPWCRHSIEAHTNGCRYPVPDGAPGATPLCGCVARRDDSYALAYLAALREVVELHTAAPVAGDESRFYCPTESYDICAWPCPTIRIVARALGVSP